jgi:selenocysteine lyase/cysteine desulfurase
MNQTPMRAEIGSRALFPHLETRVYANHASLSPPSTTVQKAVARALDGYATHGMRWYVEETARRERLRAALARLIGAGDEDLALVANTSAGVLTVALCLPWKRGDRVVVFDGEFPTNVTPWQQAARREGLELVWIKADDFRTDRDRALEQLEAEIKRGVRLVAVSAVQFTTGQRMPLARMGALCKRHGAELFVDAIQAAGIVPLDVEAMHIDYLTAGSHKWLMGPEGLAAFYAAPTAAERLRPDVAGWLSHEQPFAFLTEGPGHLRYDRPFQRGARMAEAGTFNTLGAAGLEASVALIEQLGVARILEHVQAWHDAVEPGLLERGFESARMTDPSGRSGSLSVRPPDPTTSPAWLRELTDAGIACAAPDGWLRLSPHWPNALDEAGNVLEAFDAILDRGGPQAEP